MSDVERSSLIPYFGPFDGFHAVPASVSKTCLVRSDKDRYSVYARAVGRAVETRGDADRLECWHDGQIVGRHRRAFGRARTVYVPPHDIPARHRAPPPPLTVATPYALHLPVKPPPSATAMTARGEKRMDRSQVLNAMGQPNLYGTRTAQDEIIATTVK